LRDGLILWVRPAGRHTLVMHVHYEPDLSVRETGGERIG
jgi:hypothetical protein